METTSNIATWYIYTGGDQLANNIINDSGKIGQEDECPDMLCEDGKRRDLYRCPDHQYIVEFGRTTASISPVSFKIFVQQGVNGKIREWKFPKRKKLILRPKVIVPAHA